MNEHLTTFLAHHTPCAEETSVWGDGTINLRITSYLSQELPPQDEEIMSVRAVVLHKESVLVVRDPNCYHLLPGGRREGEETLLQTLRREVLEETGWTFIHPTLIGFKHFYHLTPKPINYPYAYPDFFQVIYAVLAASFEPAGMQEDPYVLESFFQPLSVIDTLRLVQSELCYLHEALRVLGKQG